MRNYNRNFRDLFSFYRYSMRESNSSKKVSRKSTDLDWYGGVTWDEACSLATHGWEKGLEEIECYRVELYENIVNTIPTQAIAHDVSGYAVDVGAYLSNDPACFLRRDIVESVAKTRIVRVVVSLSASASVKPEIIIKRGAMICAMVDAMEQAGYSVEIVGNEHTKSYRATSETNIVLKQSNQPLNVSCLAFCLAHPAMLRRMLFSLKELIGWADYSDAYGIPIDATNQGDIYFGAICADRSPSTREMTETILSKMKLFGIELRII